MTYVRRENLTPHGPPVKGIPGLQVTGTDTNRSDTYDFLSVIRGNNGPISCRFRDKRQFRSKIPNNFPHPVYLSP